MLSSASLALLFRRTESGGHNRYAVTFANYVTAAVTAVVLLLVEIGGTDVWRTHLPTAVAVGVPGGLLFFLGFVLYQRAVAEHGPGLAGMYGKLGVLVPMILSMIVWREYPNIAQTVGMVVALAAIVVSQTARLPDRTQSPIRLLLLFQLLAMGFAEFSNKVFEHYGQLAGRAVFLVVLFTTAMLSAAGALVVRREVPRLREISWGVAVGVPNLFSSFFLIAALDVLPAAVVFPAFSAGSIVLIAVGARVLYGDRLNGRQGIAIACTLIALVLVNR